MRAAIMDSSPQPAPPATVRRPLKRTASTASLPTPSYTRERRKKQRRNSSDTEDEPQSPSIANASAKGPAASTSNRQAAGTSSDSSDGELSGILKAKAERLARVKPASAAKTKTVTVQAPLSPPRSTRSTTRRAATKVEMPTTPPPRRSPRSKPKNTLLATRDSPNNPFLVSDKNPVKRLPRMTSEEREEKPTMTYVFRGVKGTFENPLFRLPAHHRERSKLPLEHPDFSPDPILSPRRLFVSKKELDVVSEDEEEEELKLKPKRLFTTTSARVQ